MNRFAYLAAITTLASSTSSKRGVSSAAPVRAAAVVNQEAAQPLLEFELDDVIP